jgi:uncharacterized protein YfaS (alpha-2-macroglobulin family)
MAAIAKLDRGTAVRVTTETRDASGILTNPTTITCEIIGPSGTTYSAQTAMTNSSTGVYLLDKQTAESDPIGIYEVVIRATTNSMTSLVRQDSFTLE